MYIGAVFYAMQGNRDEGIFQHDAESRSEPKFKARAAFLFSMASLGLNDRKEKS